MNHINYTFFEEFKKLEKLCNKLYGTHNGITCYINDMSMVPYKNYCNILHWQSDLKQLKRLRHIRNHLAHEAGAFNENICTVNDINWVQTFYKRIIEQSDPLALQHKNSKITVSPIILILAAIMITIFLLVQGII